MKLFIRVTSSLLQRKYILGIVLFSQVLLYAQVDFTDSNLPIVIINTVIDPDTGNPTEIPDDPKILADMKIIYRPDGTRNYITDQDNEDYLDYNGKIKIELRGSSSQSLEKKQYGWTTYEDDGTTKVKVNIMGMPKENDWILNGLAYDASLIRDYLNYNLTRKLGQYATRTQFCEVIINGDYRGLYVLQEKIKDGSNRVNIEKIEEEDTEGVNLTGGYITKADKTTGGDPVAWSMESYVGWTDFIHELPKPEDVTEAQNDYIHAQFLSLETTTAEDNADISTGYPSIIDIPSFIDFMVMNEFTSNVDAYQFSTYFHKDRGGKLRAGPVWDFNLSLGLDVFGDRSKTDVWQFSNEDNEGAKFWTDLFENDTYKCYFSKRWNQLTSSGQPLNYNSITAFIDEIVTLISEATIREEERWGTVPDHEAEIAYIKSFISDRQAWVTANIGSFTSCTDTVLPSLVISRINYNPGENEEFPESDDQEFIEITNTGTATANLAGVYLSELGISYQFPANATITSGQKIYLVSNPAVFQSKYGITAFGQFVRNMPNSTQKLVLSDAFGNQIDTVEYSDTAPWPNADGNGNYLQLISTTLDNSLATSWIASDVSLSSKSFSVIDMQIFPNPVSAALTIRSNDLIKATEIYDMSGKMLHFQKQNTDTVTIDFSRYASGIYLVKVFNEEGYKTEKIIKQ